jgi:hypothetical protein
MGVVAFEHADLREEIRRLARVAEHGDGCLVIESRDGDIDLIEAETVQLLSACVAACDLDGRRIEISYAMIAKVGLDT